MSILMYFYKVNTIHIQAQKITSLKLALHLCLKYVAFTSSMRNQGGYVIGSGSGKDPDPKLSEKSDPDPKKIILDPQHCPKLRTYFTDLSPIYVAKPEDKVVCVLCRRAMRTLLATRQLSAPSKWGSSSTLFTGNISSTGTPAPAHTSFTVGTHPV